jgi:hypothetical protein
MYRVVFTSVDPRSQLLKKECGPWLPRKEDAEEWASYFNNRGHLAPASVEKGSEGKSRDLG